MIERRAAGIDDEYPAESLGVHLVGMTDNQYIVPGAGGMGELLTNSWV